MGKKWIKSLLIIVCFLGVCSISFSKAFADTWVWPVPAAKPYQNYVSGGFGDYYKIGEREFFHWGLDITYSSRTAVPIVAARSGTVVRSLYTHSAVVENFGDTGNLVVIQHDDDKTYGIYAHMSSRIHSNGTEIKVGEHINAGEQIGTMGSTGNGAGETAPGTNNGRWHLHFAVRSVCNGKNEKANSVTWFTNNQGEKGVITYVDNIAQAPIGYVDRFYGSENPNYGAANGMIHMVGYAFDYDDTSQDLELHVYVGGAAGSGAGLYRVKCNHVLNEGVVSMHGDVGDHHGCVLAIPVSERGTKDVYVYAIDIGDTFTENPMIGHGTVTITDDGHTPRGEIYSVENKDNGTIRIRGWAYDPDTPGEGIKLHVYVGGKPGTGASHYEVQTSTPSNEYNYEFDFLIPVQERGEKDVYVYALDKGNPFTTNPVIGYGWVNITKTAKSPNGYIEKIEGSDNGTIHIKGWTWDPDDITQDLMLHVYVGGAAGIGAGPYCVQSNHIRCDLAIPKDMCDAVVDKHGNVGNYHGFDLRIPVNETGTKDVYVYAIDVGTPSKDNTMLRHEIVKISAYYPNSISLNKTQLNLTSGTSETLSVNYFPSGAEIKTAWWSSSNTEVATVTNGVVTAKGLGTAVITATAYGNSDATATCTVTVTEPAPACLKPGDFTGDGDVTGKDLMRLQRYLIDKSTPMSCSGDVTGDGEITGKDLMRLQRYLVDKTTVLH